MSEIMPFLDNPGNEVAEAAGKVHQYFQPFSADAQDYAYAVANASADCRKETRRLREAINRQTGASADRTMQEFVIEQNALVALNGENYYRSMVTSNNESWNIRDRHMSQTLERLLDFHGPSSKVIVWEHNTHVGDARYTDMADAGKVNVGQLARERFGDENIFIVGFGIHSGSVIAADFWGGPIEEMRLPPAVKGSLEDRLHSLGTDTRIIFSVDLDDSSLLQRRVPHRPVGVVYDPNREAGNYVPSLIPKRYDAFFFIDKTSALHPLQISPRQEPPDTYPSGY